MIMEEHSLGLRPLLGQIAWESLFLEVNKLSRQCQLVNVFSFAVFV